MSEGQDHAPIDPENLPHPEEVGAREGQRPGDPHQALVPADVVAAGRGGLQPSTLLDDLHTVLRLGRQVGPVAGAIFRDIDRRLRRADELQEDLTAEKVAHARTDERLRSGQLQSSAHAFLTALGGAFLGFALPELKKDPSWFDGLIALIGVAMLVVGCWPIVSARSIRKPKEKARD
jgi:hypothetical protein